MPEGEKRRKGKKHTLPSACSELEKIIEEQQLSETQIEALIECAKNPFINLRKNKYHFPGKHFKIGVVSDTHLNSKKCRLDVLHTLYSMFKKEGCQFVLHAGDITDGTRMYTGQIHEQWYVDVEDVIAFVARQYPKVGIPTYFIAGKHDASYLSKEKVDICSAISAARPDLVYICQGEDLIHGIYEGNITLGDNKISIKILHPEAGRAYTESYQPQRIATSVTGGQKPNILVVGRYQNPFRIPHRELNIIQAGSTQDQTANFLRKHWQSKLAGWIMDIRLNGATYIFNTEFIPFVK